jgi:hypothetical protein
MARCNNLASLEMVDEKHGLTTKPHPHPYYVQWVNYWDTIKVTKIARIEFSWFLYTTTETVNSAGHITAEIRTTGSDDPSLLVLGSDNQKIIGGCENRQ